MAAGGSRAAKHRRAPCDDEVVGRGEEAKVAYRVWVRSWVLREEVFDDRKGAELFRLKLEASCPTLRHADVVVVSDPAAAPDATPPSGAIA